MTPLRLRSALAGLIAVLAAVLIAVTTGPASPAHVSVQWSEPDEVGTVGPSTSTTALYKFSSYVAGKPVRTPGKPDHTPRNPAAPSPDDSAGRPTDKPSASPAALPTALPSAVPSALPTVVPSAHPTPRSSDRPTTGPDNSGRSDLPGL